ncbi:MAG: STAS domain-containing protein [Planctomycetota bacterium]
MGTDLVVDRSGDSELQIIEIRGVLDAGNVEQLAHVGFEAIGEARNLEMRLASLTDVDLTGALGIVALAREARDRDISFRVDAPPMELKKLLEEQDLWQEISGGESTTP